MMWSLWLLLVSVVLLPGPPCVSGNSVCPKKCVCDHRAGAVQCFRVQAVPAGIPKDVRRLNLAYNHLKELKSKDVSGLTDLEDVLLSSCGLELVEAGAFRPHADLRTLDLQENKLRQIPRGLPPGLEALRLGHNRIQGLQESALEALRQLRLLDLQNNQISSLRSNALASLVQLECLLLDGNRIQTVQGSLRLAQLNLLSLGGNRIPSLPSAFFAPLKGLATLRLPGNGLTRVPHDLPQSLSLLNLDRNQIRALRSREMGQLRNLTSLSVAFNRLVSVDGGLRLPNLMVLEVPGNHLRVLPSRLSPLLERLDCRQNALLEITFLQVQGMRQLRHLFLENNSIRSVEAHALRNSLHLTSLALEQNLLASVPDGLPESLVRLDLKGNRIAAVQEGELHSLRRLQVLNLRRNRLTSLPSGTPALLPRLGTLYLGGNPWNCTCELLGVKRALLTRGAELPDEACSELVPAAGAGVGGGGGGGGWRAYLVPQEDRCEEEEEEEEGEGRGGSSEEEQQEPTDTEEYYDYDS